MTNLVHVIVNDPTGAKRPGSVISDAREFAAANLRGCALLPVDEDLVPPRGYSPLDGFFIRQWGDGWVVGKGSGERCCPMVLRVLPQRNHIHWVARVEQVEAGSINGRLRLTADTSQNGFMSAGLSPLMAPDLLENSAPDKRGGWTLGGVSSVNVLGEGILAMSLHGVMRNCRIVWSAVSLTSYVVSR